MKSIDQPEAAHGPTDRRGFVRTAVAAFALAPAASSAQLQSEGGALTRERRDRLSPEEIIGELKKGNERFRTGKMLPHDYLGQKRASAEGQFPAAVILGCVDSRTPAEVLFDLGIGDTFNARIAGSVVNDDLIGSIEFACAVAGAKAVVVFGHTACGAVKGAIDDVELGNLTGLLARIKPAISATPFAGDRSSKNPAYVDAVARTNVLVALDNIRRRSPILADLEQKGAIRVAGAMYDLASGRVEFLE